MSVLIYSTDVLFGEELHASLTQNGLSTHLTTSFSDAELRLYKGIPKIAIFVKLESDRLRRILSAVDDLCEILVIGDSSQRAVVKANHQFLSLQSSPDHVIRQLGTFFEEKSEVRLSISEPRSIALDGHFSSSAQLSDQHTSSGNIGNTTFLIGIYGLTNLELMKLAERGRIAAPHELPYCDVVVLRPDRSEACLNFLSESQSILPTAMISLKESPAFTLIHATVMIIDQLGPDLFYKLASISCENGPRFYAPLYHEKTQTLLENLGCTLGVPPDIVISKNDDSGLHHSVFVGETTSKGVYQLGAPSFETRRLLWRLSAQTRSFEQRLPTHLPDLVRSKKGFAEPVLVRIAVRPKSGLILVQNFLEELGSHSIRSAKGEVFAICSKKDLTRLTEGLSALGKWTGRDQHGRGWFVESDPQAYCLGEFSLAELLMSPEYERVNA